MENAESRFVIGEIGVFLPSFLSISPIFEERFFDQKSLQNKSIHHVDFGNPSLFYNR